MMAVSSGVKTSPRRAGATAALVKVMEYLCSACSQWLPLVEDNFHVSHDTASRYMMLAANLQHLRRFD